MLIGLEPDLPHKNVVPCLFPFAGVTFYCFAGVRGKKMESFKSPEHFSLHNAVKISVVQSVTPSKNEQIMQLIICLFILFRDARLVFCEDCAHSKRARESGPVSLHVQRHHSL